jgi:hypothetical protein
MSKRRSSTIRKMFTSRSENEDLNSGKPDLCNRILIEEAIAECRVTVGFRATGPQCRQGTRYVAHGCGAQWTLVFDIGVQEGCVEAVTGADRSYRPGSTLSEGTQSRFYPCCTTAPRAPQFTTIKGMREAKQSSDSSRVGFLAIRNISSSFGRRTSILSRS